MNSPCKDYLRNRRILAFGAAFHGFFVFPYMLVGMHVSDAAMGSLLTYMASIITAPIGAYLYASHKKDCKNVDAT